MHSREQLNVHCMNTFNEDLDAFKGIIECTLHEYINEDLDAFKGTIECTLHEYIQ